MHRLAAISLALLATPTLAQAVPEGTEMDLWCGLAFTLVAADAPSDATEEQKTIIARFAEGGAGLVDRARAVYLESGYSEESLNAHLAKVEAEVATQVDSTATPAAYSFEECSALLPF